MIETQRHPKRNTAHKNDGSWGKTATVLLALPLAFATLAGCTFDGDEDQQRQGDVDEMGVFQVYLGTSAPGDTDDDLTNIFDNGTDGDRGDGTGTGNEGSGLNGTFDDTDGIENVEITVSHIFLGSGEGLGQGGQDTDANGTDGTTGTGGGTGTTGTDDGEPDENDRGAPLDDNAFETRDGDSQVGAFHLDEDENAANNDSAGDDSGSPELLNTEESVELERDDDDGEFVAEAVVAPGSWDKLTIVVDEVRFELDGEDYVVQLDNGTIEVDGHFWTEAGESTQVLVWLDVIGALQDAGAMEAAAESTQTTGDQQQQQQQQQDDNDLNRETQSQDEQFEDEQQRQDRDSDGQFDATGDGSDTTAQRLDIDLQLEAHSVLIVPDAFDILSLVNDFNEGNAIDAQGSEAQEMAGGDDTSSTGTQDQDQMDQDQMDQDQMDQDQMDQDQMDQDQMDPDQDRTTQQT